MLCNLCVTGPPLRIYAEHYNGRVVFAWGKVPEQRSHQPRQNTVYDGHGKSTTIRNTIDNDDYIIIYN